MPEFDEFAQDYESILNSDLDFSGENMEYFANYKAECVHDFLGSDFKGRILDYGCGIGMVAKCLKENFDREGVSIFGFDVSDESVKAAREKVQGVQFSSDLEKLGQEPFDAIIVANVLHHVKPEERDDFFKQVRSYLSKNGLIFVFEHNPYNPLTRHVVKNSVFDKDASLLNAGEALRLMRENGMNVVERKYIVFFPGFLKKLRFLESKLGFIPMGAQYMCVGGKNEA
ncbi:class I SAM-dependent methyltransferase [Candidatus Omnitrophota bacterium]